MTQLGLGTWLRMSTAKNTDCCHSTSDTRNHNITKVIVKNEKFTGWQELHKRRSKCDYPSQSMGGSRTSGPGDE